MAEPRTIDVEPEHLRIVLDILRRLAPQDPVWAFGSRAVGKAKRYSDLDLAIMTDTPLSLARRSALAEAFSDSDLPWRVDVVDWAATTESFRQIIARDKVVLQSPGEPG